MSESQHRSALVVCVLASETDREDPEVYDLRVAVDGGLAWFHAQNTAPELFVGDGDSVSEGDLLWARSQGTEVRLVSPDKDYTDFDLALQVCEERGVSEATVIGVLGGRVDQQLGVFGSLLRHPGLQLTLRDARQFVRPVFTGQTYQCAEALSHFGVVALESAVVTVTGARWPLASARLEPLSTWGISNEPQGGQTQVAVTEGIVLFIGQQA